MSATGVVVAVRAAAPIRSTRINGVIGAGRLIEVSGLPAHDGTFARASSLGIRSGMKNGDALTGCDSPTITVANAIQFGRHGLQCAPVRARDGRSQKITVNAAVRRC